MPILRVDRLSGKTYDIEQSPNSDQRAGFVDSIKESLTERYLVHVSSRFYTGIRVRQEVQAGFPVPIQNKTRHPDDDTVICHRVRISQEPGSPLHWIYEASYRYDSGEEESPLDRPAEIEWDTNWKDEALEKDLDGELFLNSAGDRPDRPIVFRRARPVARITKNVEPYPSWWLEIAMKLGRVINSADISLDGVVVDAYHANLLSVKLGPIKIENDFEFRVAQLSIECSEEDYSLLLLDEGMRKRDGVTGERKTILGVDGQPVTQPVPLNGLGEPLVPNFSSSPPLTAVYLPFRGYHYYDFNLLPLE